MRLGQVRLTTTAVRPPVSVYGPGTCRRRCAAGCCRNTGRLSATVSRARQPIRRPAATLRRCRTPVAARPPTD